MSEMKLPELPDEPGLMCDVVPFFTEQQMLVIRDSGIRYGMEIAAQDAEKPDFRGLGLTATEAKCARKILSWAAAAIRAKAKG